VGHRLAAVVAVARRIAVAVAALVERDDAEANVGQARRELVPRVAGLVEAMEQDHGGPVGRSAIEVVKTTPGELDETHRRSFPGSRAAINRSISPRAAGAGWRPAGCRPRQAGTSRRLDTGP